MEKILTGIVASAHSDSDKARLLRACLAVQASREKLEGGGGGGGGGGVAGRLQQLAVTWSLDEVQI